MIVIYLSNYKSGWWAELLGTSGKEIELVFSAELELATSGLHLRCTQRLAMLPASLAPHVRQPTKQKKILKNEKFLRLSYIRKVISSFGNIMINRCHSRDPAQVIHVHNPPWDQCLHYRVSWFLLFSCLFCLFVWGQAVIRSGQYHLLRVAEKWQKIIVKKFQQIFVGLLDSSLFFWTAVNHRCVSLLLSSYCLLPFVVLSAKQVEEQIKATLHEQESFEASIASRWV